MTLRDQILALPWIDGSQFVAIRPFVEREAVLALLSEGPTPTQIEAGVRALDEIDSVTLLLDFPVVAEAILRAASEATP